MKKSVVTADDAEPVVAGLLIVVTLIALTVSSTSGKRTSQTKRQPLRPPLP